MEQLGRQIMTIGITVAIIGGLIWIGARFQWLPIGRLPGDIVIRRPYSTVYIPFSTSVLLSLLLTGIFMAIRMFKR